MSDAAPAPAQPAPANPTRLQLLVAFTIISVSGFGGVLYWSRRMMVDQRKWMTAEEFNEAYALCNFLPGPNIVNFAVVFGRRFGGTAGALLALLGLLGPPVTIVIGCGLLYARFGNIDVLQRIFAAVAAAAAGLTISTTLKMLQPLLKERFGQPHVMAFAAFAAVGIMRWPLYWVLAVLIPLSIAWAWGRGPR
ncbi:MAG: chromate transporter [Alphaproteobacteria bacterium]|jgi:chromate transporter|nr:chromate transporter [Alphaproteobacteria bacterium]